MTTKSVEDESCNDVKVKVKVERQSCKYLKNMSVNTVIWSNLVV